MNFTRTAAAACHPARPLPLLLMNGTADPLIPYAGGVVEDRRGSADYLSTADTLAFWRRVNGCAKADGAASNLPDRNREDASTVTRIESQCPAGRELLLYRVNGGGHRIPDGRADARLTRLVDALLGVQNRDIDAPELIWNFFAAHAPRRPAPASP
jgi:polyhydroxybutyrate depolymerase